MLILVKTLSVRTYLVYGAGLSYLVASELNPAEVTRNDISVNLPHVHLLQPLQGPHLVAPKCGAVVVATCPPRLTQGLLRLH